MPKKGRGPRLRSSQETAQRRLTKVWSRRDSVNRKIKQKHRMGVQLANDWEAT